MTYWLWSVPPDNYPVYAKTGTFAVRRVGKRAMQAVRAGDRIFAYLSGSRVIAGLFEATDTAFEDTTTLVRGGAYPHRLRVRPLAELNEEVRVPYEAFAAKLTVLDEYDFDDPDRQFRAVAQRVVHRLPEIDGRLLEFLVNARLGTDFDSLTASLDRYRNERDEPHKPAASVHEPEVEYKPVALGVWDRAAALERLVETIEARGFVYQPWHVAAYATALRTKPFVLLAGVTGVGKSRLPVLVAEATGGVAHTLPVRPDWTDSAEVLGYTDLQGTFRAGGLLVAAHDAIGDAMRYHTVVLDEMNLARPEHYLAEVLSRIEGRRRTAHGWTSDPLVPSAPDVWRHAALVSNLGLVGTVNMDESAHSFSRKVLDRAFTLELSDVDLDLWNTDINVREATPWPVAAWQPRALRLGGLRGLAEEEQQHVRRVVEALSQANAILAPVGFGVGYRMRDEAALFVLHAAETPGAFRTRTGDPVEPLDLVLAMKLLPRLAGGSRSLRQALFGLLGWATGGEALSSADAAREVVSVWEHAGRPLAFPKARYPRTAARLALMTDRLFADGFASYWD